MTRPDRRPDRRPARRPDAMRRRRRRFIVAADVVAVALITSGVLLATRPAAPPPPGRPSESPPATILIDGKPANDRGTFNVFGAKEPETEIETGLFFYAPTIIIAPAREHLLIELGNESRLRHTLTIPELDVDRMLGPFEVRPFLLRTPGPGTYEFSCRFHASQGMRGAFEVRAN